MKYSIAIVGPKEEILGFAAIGVHTFSADTTEKACDVLFQLKKDMLADGSQESGKKFAIIFVIESVFRDIPQEDYDKLSTGALPAIISLPGNRGSTGFGNEKIRRIVEKAVGSDIFGNE